MAIIFTRLWLLKINLTMTVGCIVCYIIHKKSLSNQISELSRDHQVEHGIDEYEDIDNNYC